VPDSITDWGKLLVWSFMAGFAERFVPGVLDRLSGDAGSAAEKPLIANTTNSAVLMPGRDAGQPHAPAMEDAEAPK
jgi:hypothetical protein